MTDKEAYSWLTQPGIQACLFNKDRHTNEALKVAFKALEKEVISTHPLFILEREALKVEANNLEFKDGCIEIVVSEGTIGIYEYAKSQQASMPRKEAGPASDYDIDEIVKLCDKHDWFYMCEDNIL